MVVVSISAKTQGFVSSKNYCPQISNYIECDSFKEYGLVDTVDFTYFIKLKYKKIRPAGNGMNLIGENSNCILESYHTDNQIRIRIYFQGNKYKYSSVVSPFVEGQKVSLGITYKFDSIKFYINGEYQNTIIDTIYFLPYKFYIGRWQPTWGVFPKDSIQIYNVQVYNRCLSDSEMKYIHDHKFPIFGDSLQLWYDFKHYNSTKDSIYDSSGKNHNGEIHGTYNIEAGSNIVNGSK